MGGIAFVFSGQGDQYPGMGQALAQTYGAAAEVFACCDRLRPGTSAQCFAGPEDVLKETKNTQPCLFAMEMAAAAVLRAAGVRPDVVAGFSLGELAACVQAGIFDLETGFRLVCRRGELMQKAAEGQATTMAAAVRLSAAQVRSLCSEFSDLYPVNYNAPGQTVVAIRTLLQQEIRVLSNDPELLQKRYERYRKIGACETASQQKGAPADAHI